MLISLWAWILLLTVKMSTQECQFEKNFDLRESSVKCLETNPNNFFYVFYENGDLCQDVAVRGVRNWYYSLTVTNSRFINITLFPSPCPKLDFLKFSLTNSSVETIDDRAFNDFSNLETLNLSKNKLRDLSFVRNLPKTVNSLILSDNDFERVNNVFNSLNQLTFVDLSNCKISSIDGNSFSHVYHFLALRFQNNKLTSFNVIFSPLLNLDLDLSFNNLEDLSDNFRPVYFSKLKATHNQLKNIKICQDWCNDKTSVELSFNNLTHLKFRRSFKMENLSLSNCDIGPSFNFKIIKFVTNTFDVSNNKLGEIGPNTFGSSIKINNLILFNSSINSIKERSFVNFVGVVLNVSSNLMTELKNRTFTNSRIGNLDLSRCLISLIYAEAFFDFTVTNTLDLSHNRITRILKNTFHNSTAQKINLSFNFIKKIDEYTFGNCRKLQILDLSNSRIEAIQGRAFFGVDQLSELYLQNNLIGTINFVQFTTTPAVLNLDNNTFSNLDFSFLSNSSASVVSLSNNDIQELFNNTIKSTISVREMDLSNSKICTIDVNAFLGLASVKILNLGNNCLEKIFSGTFFPLRQLVRLDLSNNKIKFLSRDAFFFGNRLKALNISFFETNLFSNTFTVLNNLRILNISNSVVTTLEDNCFWGLINLENLILHNLEITDVSPGAFNGLSVITSVNFQTVFKLIDSVKSGTFKGLSKVETLNLSHLELSSLESEAFIGLTQVTSLSIISNHLETIVNKTFVGLSSLKLLNLSSNLISDLNPDAFSGLVNLNVLSLSDNNLTVILLGTLQQFPTLTILDLHKNNINKILTGTFSNLKSLTTLDLSFNNISKIKMENLMPLTNLTSLDLTGNHLIQINHLDLIKSLRHLKFIGINENKWRCDNLVNILIAFQNYSIDWVSSNAMTLTHENIDGIKCYNICKFFYCVEEEGTVPV